MTEQPEQEAKSRSQLKREMLALRQLGARLVDLPGAQLAKISISDKLREAIAQAKTFKRSALSRQLKYIGGLMPDEDFVAIQKQLEGLGRPHRQQVNAFHEVEIWRDSLLEGNEALLDDLVQRFEAADRQYLRQLIRNANKEKHLGKSPKSTRALFRYLTELQSQQR